VPGVRPFTRASYASDESQSSSSKRHTERPSNNCPVKPRTGVHRLRALLSLLKA
jgi:hypothetical protein